MAVTERPPGGSLFDRIYDKLFHNYVWQSIFRSGYPSTPRNQMLVVATNVFLHLHPTRLHRTHVKITHTYCLGGLTFFMFLGLTVTGVLLMFYYVPSVANAYANIQALETTVRFGMLMRNLPRWMAHARVFLVFWHMMRVFYTGAYKPPREFNWVDGVVLLILTLLLSFTGYLLPWDELAFWAITVGTNMIGSAPVFGGKSHFLLVGGFDVGQGALIRFYDIARKPSGCRCWRRYSVAVHFWRIRRDGGLCSPAVSSRRDRPFRREVGRWRNAAPRRERDERGPGMAGPGFCRVHRRAAVYRNAFSVPILAIVANAPLQDTADANHTPNPSKAPWYFLNLQELLLHMNPALAGVIVPTVVLILLAAIPVLRPQQ